MNKKESKRLFLEKQLEDPDLNEFEKKSIRQRLGIAPVFSKEDFLNKSEFELLSFVSSFLTDQLPVIRRKMRTNSPFEHLSEIQKMTYYLSYYSSILEEDSLDQLYDLEDFNEIQNLILSFDKIGLIDEAEFLKSKINGKKLTEKKIKQLLDYFIEDDQNIDRIEKRITEFIQDNLDEIIKVQDL